MKIYNSTSLALSIVQGILSKYITDYDSSPLENAIREVYIEGLKKYPEHIRKFCIDGVESKLLDKSNIVLSYIEKPLVFKSCPYCLCRLNSLAASYYSKKTYLIYPEFHDILSSKAEFLKPFLEDDLEKRLERMTYIKERVGSGYEFESISIKGLGEKYPELFPYFIQSLGPDEDITSEERDLKALKEFLKNSTKE